MGLKFSLVSLFTIILGPRTEAWPEDCSASSKSNDLKTSALLYAHRCYLKDIPISIPAPINTIPDQILPSHIVVPRCSGLCLDSLGSSCIPKKIKLETHPITVYVNATPYCTSIELEHHRGPCKCECGLNPGSCNSRQHFLSDTCTCQCLPHLTREKVTCLNSTRHVWDSDTCQCTCKHITVCNHGQRFDANTCECRDMYRTTCDNTVNTSLTTYKVYLMNVILMGVLVIIVVISIYWLACKNGKRRSQVQHPATRAGQHQPGRPNILTPNTKYLRTTSLHLTLDNRSLGNTNFNLSSTY